MLQREAHVEAIKREDGDRRSPTPVANRPGTTFPVHRRADWGPIDLHVVFGEVWLTSDAVLSGVVGNLNVYDPSL